MPGGGGGGGGWASWAVGGVFRLREGLEAACVPDGGSSWRRRTVWKGPPGWWGEGCESEVSEGFTVEDGATVWGAFCCDAGCC